MTIRFRTDMINVDSFQEWVASVLSREGYPLVRPLQDPIVYELDEE